MLLEPPDRQRGFKKERILRVLLNQDPEDITKYRVAKEAEVSEPWCREYTSRLEDNGLLEDTTILNPQGLYDEWQRIRIEPNQLTVSLQHPMGVLEDSDRAYALTTYQAENLVQGFLFPSTTDFYISPDGISEWLSLVQDNGLLGGGNTRLRVLDNHVFYNTHLSDGFTTVSTPQLILDLLVEGGPCEEAAAQLIETFHSGQ